MGFLDRPKVGPHLVFYCHNSTVLYEFLWESKMKSPVIIKGRRRNHFLLKVWPSWNKQEVSFLWKVMMSISVEMWWTFKSEQKWFPYQGEIDFDHLHHHDHHRKKPSKRPPSYFKRTEKNFFSKEQKFNLWICNSKWHICQIELCIITCLLLIWPCGIPFSKVVMYHQSNWVIFQFTFQDSGNFIFWNEEA